MDSNTSAMTSQLFEETIFSCMFERVNSKGHEYADDLEVNSFISEMQEKGQQSQVGVWSKPKRVNELAKRAEPQSPADTRMATAPSTPLNNPALANMSTPGKCLFLTKGQFNIFTAEKPALFCIFDTNSGVFAVTDSNVFAELKLTTPFTFHLVVRDSSKTNKIFLQQFSQEMNPVYHRDSSCFVWVECDPKTHQPLYSRMLKLDPEEGAKFNDIFCQGMYEMLHLSKVSTKDQEYIRQAYEDVEVPILN